MRVARIAAKCSHLLHQGRSSTTSLQALQLLSASTDSRSHTHGTSELWRFAVVGGAAALAAGYHWTQSKPAYSKEQVSKSGELPSYTKEEVAKHKTPKDRIWVTYKDGVYDITEFVEQHPGGKGKIMLAAGSSIEPFWAMYQQHNKAEVRDILKDLKIGRLEGYVAGATPPPGMDPFAKEPERHPALLHRSDKPCNAETPGHILAANLITPTDVFYVRNHLPVPEIDPKTYRLRIEGEGLRTVEFTLDELKTCFKKYSVATTVQCAGNRRNEMKAVKAVKGLDWDIGAIGTAVWGGVRLRDVLHHAGLKDDEPSVAHVHFVGYDKDPATGESYAASIPVDIAVSAAHDVLLAYEMNGAELNRDHGYPLRAVVPGVVGARNVKWLGKIMTSSEESSSHWQQNDYKAFSPSTDWDTVDWSSAPAIQEPPVTSAICEPVPDAQISRRDSYVTARGYAWSGGGRDIIRVDVSLDGGKSWTTAELKKMPQKRHRAWAWTLWQADVPLPKDVPAGKLELICKATDDSYNSQPDTVSNIWNLRGVINNAWHRVPLQMV